MVVDGEPEASSLVIVRHGRPEAEDGVAPADWGLAAGAAQEIERLGRALGIDSETVVVASDERKALETAEALGGPAITSSSAFGEVAKPWFDDRAELRAATRRWFAGEPLDGWEPLAEATRRFADGLVSVGEIARLVVVTHGTVMTAWLASVADIGDPLLFWESLRTPDAFAVDVRRRNVDRRS